MVKRTPVTKINENKKITFGYSSIMSYEVFPPKKDKIHERKFDVNTTSGNKYTVTINKLVNCTCPDFQNGASRCKHICFIMDNVLHESFPRIYYNNKALDHLFKYLPGNIPHVCK